MANHVSVNITITAEDQSIANWFNYLKLHNKSISKWVSGLIAAEQLGQTPFHLSSVQPDNLPQMITYNHFPMFGCGLASDPSSVIRPDSHQVRGEHGEFIVGSSITLSFSRTEIVKFLNQLKSDHYSPVIYIKALIQKNLESLPSAPELTDKIIDNALRDYLLDSVAHYNLQEISDRADTKAQKAE